MSKFSVLRVENDTDEEEDATWQTVKPSQKVPSSKPSAKPQKRVEEPKQNIPGMSVEAAKKKKRKKAKSTTEPADSEPKKNSIVEANAAFEEFQYDVNLVQAMAESKEDFEHQKKISLAEDEDLQAAIDASKSVLSSDWVEVKPRRKPDSQSGEIRDEDTMTLDEYYARGARVYHSERANEKKPKLPSANDVFSLSDIVKDAEREASKIIAAGDSKKEKKSSESALVNMFTKKLEDAAVKVGELTSCIQLIEAERDKAKSRISNLCSILQQAEMKEKAELANELAKAEKDKRELTAEIANLITEIEQLRSRNHTLESELKKCQDSKPKEK